MTGAREAVAEWHREHPSGSRADCAAALGLGYRTVCRAAGGLDWPSVADRARAQRRVAGAPGVRVPGEDGLAARVDSWRRRNPGGLASECARELGARVASVRAHTSQSPWPAETGELVVGRWRARNPRGTALECARELGMARAWVERFWGGGAR